MPLRLYADGLEFRPLLNQAYEGRLGQFCVDAA